jgi:hypothetical protein
MKRGNSTADLSPRKRNKQNEAVTPSPKNRDKQLKSKPTMPQADKKKKRGMLYIEEVE